MFDAVTRSCTIRLDRLSSASLVAVLSACGGLVDGGSNADFTVRDSAGVRIVEYDGMPAATHSITLSEPLYRHGHREGDYQFTLPWDGALRPDGSAVIADLMNSEVVVIDPDGAFHSVLAAEGQGPGEVRRGARVHVFGQDAIYVHDAGNRRVMVFENGVVTDMEPVTAGMLSMAGVDTRRRVLMIPVGYMPDFSGPWLQGPMIRFDMESAALDTLGTYDWIPSRREAPPDNPHGPSGHATVSGGMFVHGRTDLAELVWRDEDGGVRQITRWLAQPEYPTDAHWDALVEALRVEYSSMPGRTPEQLDEMMERTLGRLVVYPDVPLPLYMNLVGDRDGGVWLGEYVTNFATRIPVPSYELVGADGVWIGTLESPSDFRVIDVAGDRVLAIVKDEFDVESIAVYELIFTAIGSDSELDAP